jgi:hypothetical protein
VDGKPDAVLRCNFLMRGVYLPAGAHQVEFHFQPPVKFLYVSLAAIAVGLVLAGVVIATGVNARVPVPAAVPLPAPIAAPNSDPPQPKRELVSVSRSTTAAKGRRRK